MDEDPLLPIRNPSPTKRGLSLRAFVIVAVLLMALLVVIFVLALS